MNHIFIIAGVPGAGKTSLLNEVQRRVGTEFSTVSFGSEMLRLCQSEKIAQHRDEMRKLPLPVQRRMQLKTAQQIVSLSGNILLDTHCAIKTPVGYIPGLTEEMLQILKPEAVVLIDAHEVEIRGRRKQDPKRPLRSIESFEDISEHKIINRVYASIISVRQDALLRIIQNRTGEFEKGVQDVIDTLSFIVSGKV